MVRLIQQKSAGIKMLTIGSLQVRLVPLESCVSLLSRFLSVLRLSKVVFGVGGEMCSTSKLKLEIFVLS